MSTPIITPDMAANMKRLAAQNAIAAGPAPILSTAPAMSAPLPVLAPPAAQDARLVPTARDLTQSRLLANQSELNRLSTTGSGVDQIKNPLLRVGAKIGDTALSVLAPGLAAALPGTNLHHLQLERQAASRVNNDLADDKEQAGTEQERALTSYTLQRPEIEQSKIDQKQTAVQQRVGQAAAARGQIVQWGEDGLPSFVDDPTSQAFADHQALSTLHESTSEKNKITADIAKNRWIPGMPEYEEAQRKLKQVDERNHIAMSHLGLQAQGLGMRREMMNANLYGMGADGNPLSGAAQIMGEDGQQHTVGLRAANTAIKQQKGVGTFNDLVGSVDTTRKAMEGLHGSGGSFADAQMIAALSDPHSSIGKYVNGKLVKGNLNDTQIEALGAVNQLREQIGILRASTGGTAAEAQAQRMLDTLPTAGDSPAIVRNKLKQIDGVLQRLSPSVTGVHGGLAVGARAPRTSGGTVTMRAPNGDTMPVSADQVEHYKAKGATVVQ